MYLVLVLLVLEYPVNVHESKMVKGSIRSLPTQTIL